MNHDYADIRRRLAEAKGPLDDVAAHDLASAVFRPAFTPEWYLLEAALRGSLDAALALVEEKLTGWGVLILQRALRRVIDENNRFMNDVPIWRITNAVLSALFAALESSHD